MQEEIWKDVVGYEGLYQVSNLGKFTINNGKTIPNGKTSFVRLKKNNETHTIRFRLGLIIANAFLPNPYHLVRVKHIDGNDKNNNVCNLKWIGLVCGVGVNDYSKREKISPKQRKAQTVWYSMIHRCYDSDCKEHKYYKDCIVCDEWLSFKNFERWFMENYIEGYQLDKDILVKENRVYSPETCCFVPQEINKVIITKKTRKNKQNKLPLGVYFDKQMNKYASVGVTNSRKLFNTPNEANEYYKNKKAQHLKDIALKYYKLGKISEKVYNALNNFKV
jgi:hypothetical protein